MKVIEQWAGHNTNGSSDKIWAAAYTDEGNYVSVHGRRGTRLTPDNKSFGSVAAARAHYETMVGQKLGKGYRNVPFDSPVYGVRSFGSGTPTTSSGGLTRTPPPPRAVAAAPTVEPIAASTSPMPISPIRPIDEDDLEQILDDPAFGIIELVTGIRAVVMSDGLHLASYYPNSQVASSVPEAVQALTKLNVSIVLDGVQTPDGDYMITDVLAWQGTSLADRSYRERIGLLSRTLQHAGLIVAGTPVRPGQMPGSTHKQLALLVARATDKRQIFERLRRSGAAGVLLRSMDAPSTNEPIREFTFQAEEEMQS